MSNINSYWEWSSIPSISTVPDGWVYNRFHAYQRVNNCVYAYVMPIFSGYQAQLYQRGNAISCELEARTEGNATIMFNLAQSWLDQYGNATLADLRTNYFHVSNPTGAWGRNSHIKGYWVQA